MPRAKRQTPCLQGFAHSAACIYRLWALKAIARVGIPRLGPKKQYLSGAGTLFASTFSRFIPVSDSRRSTASRSRSTVLALSAAPGRRFGLRRSGARHRWSSDPVGQRCRLPRDIVLACAVACSATTRRATNSTTAPRPSRAHTRWCHESVINDKKGDARRCSMTVRCLRGRLSIRVTVVFGDGVPTEHHPHRQFRRATSGLASWLPVRQRCQRMPTPRNRPMPKDPDCCRTAGVARHGPMPLPTCAARGTTWRAHRPRLIEQLRRALARPTRPICNQHGARQQPSRTKLHWSPTADRSQRRTSNVIVNAASTNVSNAWRTHPGVGMGRVRTARGEHRMKQPATLDERISAAFKDTAKSEDFPALIADAESASTPRLLRPSARGRTALDPRMRGGGSRHRETCDGGRCLRQRPDECCSDSTP